MTNVCDVRAIARLPRRFYGQFPHYGVRLRTLLGPCLSVVWPGQKRVERQLTSEAGMVVYIARLRA